MAASASATVLPQNSRILVASPNAAFRKHFLDNLAGQESRGEEAMGGAQALAKLNHFACDSVLLDKHLPDLDAHEVAGMIRTRYPRVVVEVVDPAHIGREAQEARTQAFRAEDREEDLESPVAWIAGEKQHSEPEELPGMIGSSRAIRQVYSLVRMVAPRDTTVLITGETGTGKELVAGAVHALSLRAKGPFVTLNCAAIPEALLEAELFGHARGAFTGAVQSRLGRIHMAQGGTLFLDEIGELPLSMQAKLLRFLQNGEVQRLGSSDVHRVDVRVICATNVRLNEQVQAKQFRQDLYYRLAVFPIELPPLRERAGDIGALAEHFLEKLSAEAKLPGKALSAPSLALLEGRSWDGNVRELQHVLERAFILSGNESVLRPEFFKWYGELAN